MKVVLSIIVLCLVSSAQAAMLTSSVSASTGVLRLVSGTNSCSDASVPAACSFSGMVLNNFDQPVAIQGSASAIPSLYAIDHAASITGFTNNLHARADAEVATEFVITGVTGSGFVQYVVSGDASVGSDNGGASFIRVRHGGLPAEIELIYPWALPQAVSLTSQLYPVQFGEPFAFSWATRMDVWGSGADQARERYLRLGLEILVLDAQENALANARLMETPEPAGFGLLVSGLGVMGFVFRLRRQQSR
ncbi:MAG: hypothetical protein JNN08_14890 [Bryobacterales bacterium]|nr:hypothetical protein [Bryobacterales bacterium]